MPVATLPLAPIFTRSRRPTPTRALCTLSSPSVNGVPMWSSYSSGAAPVPPSPPSTTTKSGVTPSATIALQMPRKSERDPRQSLNPAGFPPESSRIFATNRTSSRGVEKTLCAGGDTHFSPLGTPLASAISCVTFAPGSTPPMPGLAPWLSLSETIFTWSPEAVSANFAGSKSPSSVRAPKYPLPISQTRSPPCWWYLLSPPSPVSWANPPRAAPRLRASRALPLSAPKLIAETFISAMS